MYSKLLHHKLIYLILVLTSSMYSCAPPQPHPAVSAYQQLITAFSSGRSDEVWRILSRESRMMLIQRISTQDGSSQVRKHLSSKQVIPLPKDDLDQVPDRFKIELDWALESPFTAQAKLAPSRSQRSSTQDPSRFQEISVFYASQSWLIPAIFEHGAWHIHLLGARPTLSTTSLPHR